MLPLEIMMHGDLYMNPANQQAIRVGDWTPEQLLVIAADIGGRTVSDLMKRVPEPVLINGRGERCVD